MVLPGIVLGLFLLAPPPLPGISAALASATEDSWFPLEPGTRFRYEVLTEQDHITWTVLEDPRPGFVRLETLRHRNGERAWSALRVGADGVRFVEMHSITSPGDSLRSYPEWRFFAPPAEGAWGVDSILRRYLSGIYTGAPNARRLDYRHEGVGTREVSGRVFETLEILQQVPGGPGAADRRVWFARGIGPVRIEAMPMVWGLGTLELAPEDLEGPEPVGEITIESLGSFEALLSWDLPRDAGGIAATREIRLARGRPEQFDWDSALPLERGWEYLPGRTRDSLRVDNLVPGTEHVLAIRYGDDLGNLQSAPRLVSLTTPPADMYPGDFLPLLPGAESTYLLAGDEELFWRVSDGESGADRVVVLTRASDPIWRVRLGLDLDPDGVRLLWVDRAEDPFRQFVPPLWVFRRPAEGRRWSFASELIHAPADSLPEVRVGEMRVLGREVVDLVGGRAVSARVREYEPGTRAYDHWYAPGIGLLRTDRFPFLPELGQVVYAPAPGEDLGDDGSGGTPGKETIPGVVRFLARSPFRDEGVISLSLREARPLRVDVFDVLGRRMVTLLDETVPAGDLDLFWDGRDDRGRDLPATVYFVRLSSDGGRSIRRMVKLP